MNTLMEARNLSIAFDGFKALDRFSFSLKDRELLCIIGPNGAGKTTLLNALTGRIKPDQGEVFFLGDNITGMLSYKIARKGVGRKFQTPQIIPNLSVWENLALASASRAIGRSFIFYKKSSKIRDILDRVGLQDEAENLASYLSHGQKQWLEIGMILAQNPKVILLDEPVTGMTTHEIQHTAQLLEDLCQDHGVIVIEHDMNFIRQVAKKVIVMHQGSELFAGPMDDVQKHEDVKRVYLGEGSYAHH